MNMTIAINPSLLSLARESRGMSQKDLAQKLGLSTGKVCRVEQGDQSYTDEVMNHLVKELDYPLSFYSQVVDAYLPTSIDFRKRLKVPQKDLTPIIAHINLYRLNIEELVKRTRSKPVDLPKLSMAQLSDPVLAAKAVRKLWGLPTGPVKNLTSTLEKHGVFVIAFDFGTERVDSRSIITKDGHPILFLNKTMLGDRARFSLAYELGHLVLHNTGDNNERDVDHEAKAFAAELLMPEKDIKGDLVGNLSLPTLGELKKKWGVSMQALLFRATDLQTITYNHKRYVLGQFNAIGIRRREPQEFDVPIEQPKLLRDLITKYRNKAGLSVKEMADVFHLSHEEFLLKYVD